MSAVAQVVSYDFAVFLEGIRIPVLGFDVNFSMESSFNINVVPINEFNDLKPNTHAFIAYRENRASKKWYLLAEGVYMGPSYSRAPSMRTMRLKFRDVQWFLESARVYDLITMAPAHMENFALREAAFLGDTRYVVDKAERVDVEASTQITTRFNFLNALQTMGKDDSLSPLAKPFEALWALLARTNDFFQAHAKGFKLNEDRVHIIDNKRMGAVYTSHLVYETFAKLFGEFTNQTNVMDLMLMLMQIIQYDLFPIPGMAASNGSTIRSYVAKPIMNLVTPPACNVVFPDEISILNYDIDYQNRLTRLWYREVLDSFGSTRGFIAPKEVEAELDDAASGMSRFHLTEEERLRGINPQIAKLPWAYTRGISTQLDEEQYQEVLERREEYHAAFANYMFYDQMYMSTPMNLQMKFNPRLLPGFPMLILDPIMPMIGSVINVGHYVDIQSATAYTGVTLSHMRPANVKVPTLTGWYDESTFTPENIGKVYAEFGTRAFFEPGGSTPPPVDGDGMVDFFPAVKALYEEYESTRGQSRFLYGRAMPTFWDEGEGRGDILDVFHLRWEEDRLVPTTAENDGTPFTINYNGQYPTTSSVRRPPVEALKQRITAGESAVWKRDIEEGGVF